MDKGVSYIQSGWKVRTSDGHDLGTVVDLFARLCAIEGR